MPEQLHNLQDVLNSIRLEADTHILYEQYHLRDNLTLLLLVDEKQRKQLEQLLEQRYEKSPSHQQDFQYCGGRDYHHGKAKFRYKPETPQHGPFGVVEFISQTGWQPNVNSRITFHNIGVMTHDEATLAIKSAYVDVVQQVMRLNIPVLISRQNAAFNPTTGNNPAVMNATTEH